MALLPDNKNPKPVQQAAPQPKRKGTGFTNLQRILQASQGSKLGQTIAGGITGQAQQVQSGIQSAQEQFKKEAEAKRVGTEKDVERAKNVIEQAASGQEITSALPDFKRYLSGEYTGPMELANRQQLAAQAQQAETVGRLASGIGSRQGTEPGGRQQLLSRFAGGADYTSGQRKLDESILARDKDANLAAAARQTRGVAEQAQRAGAIAQQEAQQYQNLAKIFARETREKIGEAKNPIYSDIDTQIEKAKQKESSRLDFLKDIKKETDTLYFQNLSEPEKAKFLQQSLQKAGPGEGNLNILTQQEIDNLLGQSGYLGERQKTLGESKDFIKRYLGTYQPRIEGLGGVSYQDISQIDKNLAGAISGDILSQIIGSSEIAKNLTRQGVASEDQARSLNLLNKLMQKDEEIRTDRDVFKAGTVALPTETAKKELQNTRLSLIDKQMNVLNESLKNMHPVDTRKTVYTDMQGNPIEGEFTSYGAGGRPMSWFNRYGLSPSDKGKTWTTMTTRDFYNNKINQLMQQKQNLINEMSGKAEEANLQNDMVVKPV